MKGALAFVTGLAVASSALVLATPAEAAPTATYVGITGSDNSPIALDSSGRLFALAGSTIRIYPSATNLSGATLCTVTLVTGATDARAMAIDSSGRVYLSFESQDKVAVYANPLTSCTAAPVQTISTASNPKGLAVASDGSLWVATLGSNSVQVFSSAATSPTLSATYPVPGGPYGVALDGTRYAYVTSLYLNAVYRADLTAGSIAFVNLGLVGLSTPIAVSAQSNGLIQVLNNGANSTVKEYDTSSGQTTARESLELASLSGGYGGFYLVGPSSSSIFAGFYSGRLVSVSGLGIVSTPGDPSQAPAPILQQLPANADGTCTGISDTAVAYGTGLTGGWHGAWAQWANGGHGGPVCARTLVFDSAVNRWTIAA